MRALAGALIVLVPASAWAASETKRVPMSAADCRKQVDDMRQQLSPKTSSIPGGVRVHFPDGVVEFVCQSGELVVTRRDK